MRKFMNVKQFAGAMLMVMLAVALLAPRAHAWHASRAVIDDVRYVNRNGGVTFFVDFRIWEHLGYTGAVRIRITDGIDTLILREYFRPAYNPAYYRDFGLYVSNVRLATEGLFVTQSLHVTVDILDSGGNILAQEIGFMSWAGGWY